MSLQVWLPLVRDLSNQGLSTVSVTNSGATYDASGKLGGSYYFNGSSYIQISMPPIMTSIKNSTVCAWVKSTGSVVALGGISNDGNYTNAMVTLYTSGWQFAGGSAYKYISGGSIANSGVWHHVCCTVSDTTITTYLDGTQVATNTLTGLGVGVTDITPANFIEIGCDHPGGNEFLTGYVNDFRVYDECLSQKHIKLLSQGLVAHYTLGDRYASENLIINGFGELGSENWESTSLISTTEIPSSIDTNIKESFYSGNIIKEYIPLGRYNTYTISAYIKAMSGATSYSYPSIYPYDADKKFIATYNCLEGFSSTYKTTLSQPLHKGDTVIYATDLSAWTTGDNYYFHVAIFGYKNSFGYKYPDMEYTQDSPKFGSRTDKSNINKTNNTITLLSAYTGEDRPAGTVICQATEGSTYWYPFGVINPSTVPDWTFKTCTFVPDSINRLRWATYVKYMAYYSVYHAGIKLVDNTDTDRTIYDSSGYNYHGQQWAYDAKGNIVSSLVTPRYSYSTYINSENNTTSTASGTQMIYCPCALTTPNYLTVAFWCKPIAGYGSSTGQGQFGLTMNDVGIGAATDYNTAPMHHRDACIDMNTSGNTHKTVAITFTANEWHHYAIVYDGRYGRVYKDGVAGNTLDMGSNVSLASMKAIVIGYSHAGGVIRSNKSLYSDFRLYTTALSADDIKELYQTSASIDKSGNMYAYEFKEV